MKNRVVAFDQPLLNLLLSCGQGRCRVISTAAFRLLFALQKLINRFAN